MSQIGLGYVSGNVSPAHSQCASCPIDCAIGKKSWGIGICILIDLHLALTFSQLACDHSRSHLLGNDSHGFKWYPRMFLSHISCGVKAVS